MDSTRVRYMQPQERLIAAIENRITTSTSESWYSAGEVSEQVDEVKTQKIPKAYHLWGSSEGRLRDLKGARTARRRLD
jgi:hypothetical protein